MQELLREQIKQAIENGQGIIVLDPKNESSEYIQDIIEVAKKHNKLQNIIYASISSVDDCLSAVVVLDRFDEEAIRQAIADDKMIKLDFDKIDQEYWADVLKSTFELLVELVGDDKSNELFMYRGKYADYFNAPNKQFDITSLEQVVKAQKEPKPYQNLNKTARF